MAGLFHAWISKYFKKMGVIPILQRRKLRHREVKWYRQSYAGRLVTCLRLEHNLFIPEVPLLIFSSRLHLFTRPLPHSFSSLQNKAPSSLPDIKLLLSIYKISAVSRVSEPNTHLHICHWFEIALSSSTPPHFSLNTEEETAVTLVLCHTSNTPSLSSRLCDSSRQANN